MTDTEKIEAIRALIAGEWDNEQLEKIGPLYPDFKENVINILEA